MNSKMPNAAAVLLLAFLAATAVSLRTYTRCRLARELKYEHNAPDSQLATWVCIAWYESYMDASYRSLLNADNSREYGLFGFNNYKWCYPPGRGCNLTCEKARDQMIGDDFACAQTVYRKTARRGVSGFSAWPSYAKHCNDSVKVAKFLKECFD